MQKRDGWLGAITTVSITAFRPLERFLSVETRAGTALMATTVLALVLANSPLSERYFALWATPVSVQVGPWGLAEPLLFWINDLLMAAFFLLVGLEIKRELLVGELNTARKAALPLIAAIGGMVAPALIYLAIAWRAAPGGWGVPMATDIAFAIGVARLLGSRVPAALLVFLTAFAIADDLGAVVVIALFYGHEPHLTALLAAGGITALLAALNLAGVRSLLVYVTVGMVLWGAVLASGIHATLAGVIVGMCIPAGGRDRATALATADAVIEHVRDGGGHEDSALEAIEHHVDAAQSPLHNLEHALHPYVAFGIIPLFALANAGVDVRAMSLGTIVEPVSLGVAAGLVLGKPIGIFTASWLAVKSGLAELPTGIGWRQMFGAGVLGGIGFTMALFVAGLAFEHDPLLHVEAKLGILLGSCCAAALGAAFLMLGERAKPAS